MFSCMLIHSSPPLLQCYPARPLHFYFLTHVTLSSLLVAVPQLIQQAIESESRLGLAMRPYIQEDISGK